MQVPFLDLKRNYLSIQTEIDEAVRSVLGRGFFVLGEKVREFEEAFARYCGVSYGVGVASGTDALHLALRACGVGPGDEVITVANTCAPTLAGIHTAGAKAHFVDVDPQTLTLDPKRLEGAIGSRTTAVLPVHLYGRCADMDPILETAGRHGLKVIEDCAQAHGALYKGRKAGGMGDAGCFSFYPTKNLGAFGDGGMVVTKNPKIAEKVKLLRNYGETKRYEHTIEGFNSRLDELQAAVLLVKLNHLDRWNGKRRELAERYREALGKNGVCFLKDAEGTQPAYHLFVARARERESFRARLGGRGVQTLVHYPQPLPRQKAYAEYAPAMRELEETRKACEDVVSLPLFPEMTKEEQDCVIGACRESG